jgi:hypothetical protein
LLLPSKEADPVIGPVKLIVLEFYNLLAVAAFPNILLLIAYEKVAAPVTDNDGTVNEPVIVPPDFNNEFEVLKSVFTMCGTATPTKDTGPANAVTVADNTLDMRISRTRRSLTFTPTFLA